MRAHQHAAMLGHLTYVLAIFNNQMNQQFYGQNVLPVKFTSTCHGGIDGNYEKYQ